MALIQIREWPTIEVIKRIFMPFNFISLKTVSVLCRYFVDFVFNYYTVDQDFIVIREDWTEFQIYT